MTLAEFQALFQACIHAGAGPGDDAALKLVRPSPHGAAPQDLLGVYQSGYRIRLVDYLAEDHPGLLGLLGDDDFEALAAEYIAAQPPRDRNARWYTTGLPDFMRKSPRWRDNARAVSMALFERAIVDAFDAADSTPLGIGVLSALPSEDWPSLVFGFHPSLTLHELTAGTLETYDVVTGEDAAGPPPPQEGVERVAVWRVGHESAFRELEPDEYVALSEALAGAAFGDICQMTAFQQSGEIEPERLAQCLASWFEDGMIVSAACAASCVLARKDD